MQEKATSIQPSADVELIPAFTQLLQYMTDNKIAEVARIKEIIPTIEERAKISLNDFLGKQPLTPLQTITFSFGGYYGELNVDGKPHGRGIIIDNSDRIYIGYFDNSCMSAGNNINIYWDG